MGITSKVVGNAATATVAGGDEPGKTRRSS
jgi:hypothetical protein